MTGGTSLDGEAMGDGEVGFCPLGSERWHVGCRRTLSAVSTFSRRERCMPLCYSAPHRRAHAVTRL